MLFWDIPPIHRAPYVPVLYMRKSFSGITFYVHFVTKTVDMIGIGKMVRVPV
jgi:hypothetical protein